MTKEEFELIYRRHYPPKYRLARRLLYAPQESKDVVSEVFAHLLRGGVMPDSDKMEGHLMTAVPMTLTKNHPHPNIYSVSH